MRRRWLSIVTGAGRRGRRCYKADGTIVRRTPCRLNVFGALRRWGCGHDNNWMLDGGRKDSSCEAVAGRNRTRHVALSRSHGGAAAAIRESVGGGRTAAVTSGKGVFSREGKFVSHVEL